MDVAIIGNSVGPDRNGDALHESPRVSAIVLIDAVGLDPSDIGGAVVDPLQPGPAVLALRCYTAVRAFSTEQRHGGRDLGNCMNGGEDSRNILRRSFAFEPEVVPTF